MAIRTDIKRSPLNLYFTVMLLKKKEDNNFMRIQIIIKRSIIKCFVPYIIRFEFSLKHIRQLSLINV